MTVILSRFRFIPTAEVTRSLATARDQSLPVSSTNPRTISQSRRSSSFARSASHRTRPVNNRLKPRNLVSCNSRLRRTTRGNHQIMQLGDPDRPIDERSERQWIMPTIRFPKLTHEQQALITIELLTLSPLLRLDRAPRQMSKPPLGTLMC
jgi:hypothetical protein